VSILVLDVGGLAISVQCQRGGHAPPRLVGTKPVSGSGNQTSSVRAELMVVPVVLIDYSPAIAASIRALFANGAQVPCSGDVFNNGGVTITCSATFSDEFEPAGPWFGLAMTLYEIGTTLGYTSGSTTSFRLTDDPSDEDPGDGSILEADPDGSPWGDCFRVLDAATPATCGSGSCAITYSASPERTWLTNPLAAGTLSGTPYLTLGSKGINGASNIAVQSTKAILYHVRAGVDLDSWETGYVPGHWSGGTITLTFPSGFLVSIQTNDRFRVELWGRLSLLPGTTDPQPYVLARQTICYPGQLVLGGSVVPV
jgi:hypothetical protein